jgi:hypothetical protein
MRSFARIAGLVWVVVMLAGWVALLALGRLHGGRGPVLLLSLAAGPGILAYRWGRGAVRGSHTRLARRAGKPKQRPYEREN